MMYIFAIIAVVSFGAGFGTSYQISKAEIQHMSDGIAAQNREAELQYAALTEEANKATAAALKANIELEDANAKTIKNITRQRDDFKLQRMYDTHRKGSSCPPTKITDSSTVINTATDDGELSIELTEFLKSEAFRADEISAYAILCDQFIKEVNSDAR